MQRWWRAIPDACSALLGFNGRWRTAVTAFAGYWNSYADATEAALQARAEWSSASLAKGIVQGAVLGLAHTLSPGTSFSPAIEVRAPGLAVETYHHEYKGYRFVVCGLRDEIPNTPLTSIAREVVELSREAFCLCVLPSARLQLSTHIAEAWPTRAASVVTFFPGDIDAVASGKAEVLDLVQFKLYRRLVLDKPDAATLFDDRLFEEYLTAKASSAVRVGDLQAVGHTAAADDHLLVDHPLLGRVQAAIERGRSCLLVGPSSSGKSVLAFQVGKSLLLRGKSVGYLNLGLVDSTPAPLFDAIASPPNESARSLLIVDDLQSNPSIARYVLALSSAVRRATVGSPPAVLAVSWVDFSADAITWFDDCLPVAVRSHQIRQRIAARYQKLLAKEDIDAILGFSGDDVFLLRLFLDQSVDRGVRIAPNQLAQLVWEARTKGSDIGDEEARRVGLVAAALGRFDIAASPGFLRHESRTMDAAIQGLVRSGLLRRQQANLSLGHRSLATLLADWLGQAGGWAALSHIGGAATTGTVVLDYLRSLGSSLAVDSLRALQARAGFKDRPRLNKRAVALVEIWDAFNAVLERIEHQEANDPTWDNVPSSAMFAVTALAEVGRIHLARNSIAFLRRHWRLPNGVLEITTAGLSTIEDFVQIQRAMAEEDADIGSSGGLLAGEIDIERFHRTWFLGLVLCTEAAAQNRQTPLGRVVSAVEREQLPSGAFYPERVPWCTARVLLGLAACGRTVDTSPAVASAVKWLLRDRSEGGACSGGVWHSGTGAWNSSDETTGMVLLALAASGHDCSDPQLEPAQTFLLSQKSRWTAPGRELEGALVIQALLDTGGSWDDVATETQALSRWAKGEAFWQSATRSAKDSLNQSCRVAQIASHLVSIGWTAIRTDLPAFLDALKTSSTTEVATSTRARPSEVTLERPAPESFAQSIAPHSQDSERDALLRLDRISLQECCVVGEYRRHDERVRNILRDWQRRIERPFREPTRSRENFLIWAAPGSGKSFFIQEIARLLAGSVRYVEANLANLSREEFAQRLLSVKTGTGASLCLLDEIDARSQEKWPYEECFSDLDLNLAGTRSVVFVLIGSSPSGLQGMVQQMLDRSKGKDLLDRVPAANRFEIPELTIEDRAVVIASQVISAARTRGEVVRSIEKLALYYALKNQELRTPRQLRELAVNAVGRMSSGDDRLKFDDLFARGDNRDKEFWVRNQEVAGELSNIFLRVDE